uniref:hypothetical protein n=1 Tax=Arthrobacter sp. TaxID=1667 RepID=UPI00159EEA9A|nr:hypothetical protein [Arthrobacter sp.]
MKINYNATASGGQKEVGVDVNCREIITIAGILLGAVILGVIVCLTFGIDPLAILELAQAVGSPALS